KPEIVVNVSYTDFTDEGHLRHPVFNGIRDDVAASACTAAPPAVFAMEPPDAAPEPPAEPAVRPAIAPSKRVPISNRSKVSRPDEGYTKGELIDYDMAISPALLPFLRDRPIVLVRY